MANSVIADSKSAATPKKGSRPLLDLTGRVFERLTVIDRAPTYVRASGKRLTRWNCRCICGTEVVVLTESLVGGNTRSCGCFLSSRMKDFSGDRCPAFKHGHALSPAYASWSAARHRVMDKSNKNYGGRGITMCEHWFTSFDAFYEDMGDRPAHTTLDRIDNDGPYSPENCRWATPKEQGRNRRTSVLVEIKGESKTLTEWSEISGVPRPSIWKRINYYGWTPEKAVFTPPRR